jgi:septal ring factor EnvC (AmiA/AmiB activator)
MTKTNTHFQNKKRYSLVFALILSALSAAASNPKLTIKQLNKTLVSLNKKQSFETQKRNELNASLRHAEKLISDLQQALEKVATHIKQNTQTLLTLKKEQKPLEASFKTQQNLLIKQLTLHYELGKYQYLKLILNQRDPMLTSRLLSYMAYINRSRAMNLNKLAKLKKSLTDKKIQTEQSLQHLKALNQTQAQDETRLQLEVTHQTQLVNALNQTLSTRESKIKKIQADKKRLQRLIDNLDKKQALSLTQYPFSQMKHRLPWPVRGALINHFGNLNEDITHHGVTINAPEGRPITSVHSGKVVFADWLKGFGLLLIVSHGQGYMTLYANNQTLYRKIGDMVKTGDLIAKIGHTGGQLKNGLYFEIRYKGKPINPSLWLASN